MTMWKVLACLLVVAVGVWSSRRRVRLCPHQSLPMEESFFLVPQLANVSGIIMNTPPYRSTYMSGDRTCPDLNGTPGLVCPWHYRMNYDRDREPKFVIEAVCNCRQCRAEISGSCRPVNVPRTVLRRRQGYSCMSWVVEEFAVACTCSTSGRHIRPVSLALP